MWRRAGVSSFTCIYPSSNPATIFGKKLRFVQPGEYDMSESRKHADVAGYNNRNKRANSLHIADTSMDRSGRQRSHIYSACFIHVSRDTLWMDHTTRASTVALQNYLLERGDDQILFRNMYLPQILNSQVSCLSGFDRYSSLSWQIIQKNVWWRESGFSSMHIFMTKTTRMQNARIIQIL